MGICQSKTTLRHLSKLDKAKKHFENASISIQKSQIHLHNAQENSKRIKDSVSDIKHQIRRMTEQRVP